MRDGMVVGAVLLSVPLFPPFAGFRLVTDQAAFEADPPKPAPVRDIAAGDALRQTRSGPPAVIVAG